MKQNVKNLDKQKIYKRRRIALLSILALVAIIILVLMVRQKNNIQKIALGENALVAGGEDIDLSKILSSEPNPPVVGAGMIPIKWDETLEEWIITTANDPEWYDYSKGKWANVMLSDRQIFIRT